MPLIKSNLSYQLSTFMDSTSPFFIGYPKDVIDSAYKWSNAMQQYASTIIPPSLTLLAATSAMQSILINIAPPATGMILLPNAIQQFGIQLSLGMQPAFTGIPPTVPPVLDAVYAIGKAGGSAKDCIDMFSTIIDAWFRTGMAVNNASGVTIPWS